MQIKFPIFFSVKIKKLQSFLFFYNKIRSFYKELILFDLEILTILQGNYAEEIAGRLDMTSLCKQNRNSKRCLFPILLILIWRLKKRSQQNKGTLILEVEVPAAH